ncbi:unnamed protein product [Acanthoscelides obtectus]|uniref:DUF4536 domain-containing protein n=1 Tax=Acanthoscelides obtectus TaxID=200917 RepID=A0A9P0NT74_ACAOB|nr:unnamed protein product [Acanthoscelides obtectus]CAK1655087.1 hypothetical protein AOBTE_LOCUS19019 [Acanthoscelides obtectus]
MKNKMNSNEASCLSCKIITVSCLTGIGAYLLNTAKIYKGNSKIILSILGTGSIALGVGAIFDCLPFKVDE